MHIGIDASRLAVTNRTGTERYTFELLGALARLDRHLPYTLYYNRLPATLPPLGPNFSLRAIPFPRLWTYTRLSLEMAQHPPDVLFVPAHVVPLRHPSRSIVTIHDLGYLVFPQAHTAARRLELHFSTLWSTRAAQRIIAVSHATRQALIDHYGTPADKITVVHHGVSSHFRPVSESAIIEHTRTRYGIEGQYVLYIGTLQPRKNLVRLIEAFARLVHGETDSATPARPIHLVLAGKKGWLTHAIEQRSAELGIAGQVHFTGYVDDGDIPALLSGALAFVFPSLYEGFGMPVLEAMACGTPVLTSTTTSLPEVAGDAALLVNPHDTQAIANGLARLACDTSLRESLRARGLERVATFSWARCAEETRRVVVV
jgi:glycosyltransferase involved in cell wall biosynthesis